MSKAAGYFSDADRAQINQAVAQAEARTAAEFVPAVAYSSGRYDRPEDVVGLWLGLLAMIVVWQFFPPPAIEPGSWGNLSHFAYLAILIAMVVIGFFAGAILADNVGWLRRLFTPTTQMRDEVHARARQVFFDSRMHHTDTKAGVMIYISLFERMAAVVADRHVLEKLGQAELDALRDNLVTQLKTAHPRDALCHVLALAGEKLAAVLPRAADDVNELTDALVVID